MINEKPALQEQESALLFGDTYIIDNLDYPMGEPNFDVTIKNRYHF